MEMDGPFSDGETERISDPYRSHSLVNIAVSTLMRNIGRAFFRITRDGEFITSGPVFELFRDVNPVINRFDLWKVTSAWWFQVLILGKRCSGSSMTHTQPGFLQKYLFLIPAKNKQMRAWAENGVVRRWVLLYRLGPILPDEIVLLRNGTPQITE